eukprot:164325-Prorocentrum_minimum.AAC.1
MLSRSLTCSLALQVRVELEGRDGVGVVGAEGGGGPRHGDCCGRGRLHLRGGGQAGEFTPAASEFTPAASELAPAPTKVTPLPGEIAAPPQVVFYAG